MSVLGRVFVYSFALVGAGLLGCLGDSGFCENRLRQDAVSPTGEWRAVVFVRDCGAVTSRVAGVSIVKTTTEEVRGYPNLFAAGYLVHWPPADKQAVLEGVAVRWTSDSVLIVEYDDRSLIRYQVTVPTADLVAIYEGKTQVD